MYPISLVCICKQNENTLISAAQIVWVRYRKHVSPEVITVRERRRVPTNIFVIRPSHERFDLGSTHFQLEILESSQNSLPSRSGGCIAMSGIQCCTPLIK